MPWQPHPVVELPSGGDEEPASVAAVPESIGDAAAASLALPASGPSCGILQVPPTQRFGDAQALSPLQPAGQARLVPSQRNAPQLPVRGEQVPSLPAWLQEPHASRQAVSQHAPPLQKWLAHSSAAAQEAPLVSVGTQLPPEQRLPAAQSVPLRQLVRQDVVPQPKAPQDLGCAIAQFPRPLQVGAGLSTPVAQVGAPQVTVPAGKEHAVRSAPLHAPPQALPSLLHAARVPAGAPIRAVHLPCALQASH